nr:reverse transcriptase domain-containing protein [Tanacetum cinerariifolium]
MSTRSSARNLFPPLDNPELTIRSLLNDFEMATEGNGDPPVLDLRTMNELCQPSLNGRGGPIAPIAIQATNFKLKNDMIQQSIKVNGVTDDALCLYLFPHSLTHHATAWFDHLPRNSINTFKKMAKMFLGRYFPPSMVTKLRNEITNFRQRPDEALFKAWERYKLSIDRCPNHNMLPVTQIDTFYNGLTLRHRDTINAVTGGTFMKRHPEESTVGQTQGVYAAGAYQGGNSYHPQGNRNLLSDRSDNYLGPPSHGQNPPPAYQAPGYQAPVHQPSIPQPQVVTTNEFTNFMKANDVILKNMQTNMTSLTNSNLELKNMFGQFMKMNTTSSLGSGTLLCNTITNPKEDLKGITTRSGTAYQGPKIPTTSSSLPKVVERETKVKKDTVHPTYNRSTKDVQPPVVQTETPILNSEPVVAPIIEPVVAPVSALKPNQKLSIPYPSRLHDQKLRDKANDQREKFFQIFKDLNFSISFADALILMPKFGPSIKSLLTNKDKLFELARTPLNEHCSVVLLKKLPEKLEDPDKFLIPCDFSGMAECLALADFGASINLMPLSTERDLIDVFKGELTLRVGREAITFNLDQTSRYSANYNDMTANRIDVIDMACEEHSQEVLGFSDVIASGNPTPYYDPIVSTSSPTVTPFGDSDFLLQEVDAFLALENDATSPEVDQSYFDPNGDIILLEAFLNDNPSLTPPTQGNYPPQVELKDLPLHLEYVFLEGDDKLPVIIAKDLCDEEKTALIKVLKSYKRVIAWKLFDIKGKKGPDQFLAPLPGRCGRPSDRPVCYLCTCEQCGNILSYGTCLNCNSETGNSFTHDPIPESFDEVQVIPDLLPQCHFNIYLCQICESNSHYGYEYPLIDHHCCYECGNSLNDFFCPYCTCEFCGNGAHVGYNCPAQVPSFQTLPSFPQQYPCCEDCGGISEADHCQPPQYTVNHLIFNAHNDLLNANNDLLNSQNKITIAQNKLMEQLTSMCAMVCQLIQKKQEEKQIEKEQAANARYWKIPACCDDDDDYNSAITPNEPVDSLCKGDEHLNTISATESDEFLKSSVENLVPNQSESEGENGCDVPACFTTFLNVLFDADYEFDSSDDQSCSDEDVPEKIFLNPLFEEEIISMKIDQHHHNVESDLIESLLNHDSSIISSFSKIDFLLDEFASELTLLKSIPPGIDETDCDHEEDIPEIESFSPSPIPAEDFDSFMEEIDLSYNSDDPMPPSIEEDDDESERDILILEELLDNYSLSLLENESFHFDIPSFSHPPVKPPDGNTGILNIKMMGDNSEQKVPIPGLTITRVPNQEKYPDLLSHRGLEIFLLSAKCPMIIHGKNIPILDVPLFYFYPP